MEQHLKHGAFSWNELATPDPEAAKKFYGTLFGWKFEERDMGHMVYNIAKVGDDRVGGIMKACEGMTPMWCSYITVDNVDETAKQAAELGGKVIMGPQDIPEVGRFVILLDPQGILISAITYVSGMKNPS